MRDTKTSTEPAYVLLWYRTRAGDSWQKMGRYSTRAEAVTAISTGGDWHIQPVYALTSEQSAKLEAELTETAGTDA